MGIMDVLTLLCGLALFLYGMNVMGDALKKGAGSKLKRILAEFTSNPIKGFLLGLGTTAIMQSSSATTVMVVGFVNSGIMTLTQSVGVILGANVGSAVTFWLTGLSGLGEGAVQVSSFLQWLKPTAWVPILAVAGVVMCMFSKNDKKKNIGAILLGFTILMVGMETMSGSIEGLKNDDTFKAVLTTFENPALGLLAGTAITAVIQSSAASVGILQSLSTTGAISYAIAIPVMLGQNIGTCITAMLSSINATKNAKRAALVHLYFNVITGVAFTALFWIVKSIWEMPVLANSVNMWSIAGFHTVFKILSVIAMAPFVRGLEKLATISVKDSAETERITILDERLFKTPSVAVETAREATVEMARISCDSMRLAMATLDNFDPLVIEKVRKLEDKADEYEDMLGTYLVKLAGHGMTERDSHEITKLLHLIGDFERISDHAVNVIESAEEMNDKKVVFSAEATRELSVLRGAVDEILRLAEKSFVENDLSVAVKVEPLEQVVDGLKDQIKANHILRLQKNECTIEHGFVLSDLLTNFERVSDHCSNIAGCVIEISKFDALAVHGYLHGIKSGDSNEYESLFAGYQSKYAL